MKERARRDGRGGPSPAPPPACLPLAEALRELRERTGLSLDALGRRTAYSKSSWERYLNGKKPVPRKAVVALCALADEPPGRLLALWDLADAAWSGRSARGYGASAADGPGGDGAADDMGTLVGPAGPVPDGAGGARRRWSALALGIAAVVVVAAGVTAGLAVTRDDDRRRDHAASEPGPGPYEPRCVGAACEGRQPQKMGCGGPGQVVSLATRSFAPERRVELRVGKACNAVWARATGLLPGDRVVVSLPGARVKELRADEAGDTRRYLATPMTALKGADPAAATVCVTFARTATKTCFSG
ncbi:helix-turn-helix domain-containing protein [Streptomyces spectabilis]|uniref:Helix-turn-helix domain-containing protein n=1 Tax=Streptomyces spectabilis TaxID=68270 RepID=A0A516RC79_STRST|nr:XRE family transcriptional regulator [Streptomyces spectabilis]QDQ13267.1 helix-turn-helix domain-containing protein [Streptomyces spectabilis]